MRKVLPWPPSRFQNEYFIFLLPLFFVFHGFNEHYGKIPIPDVLLLWVKYSLAMVVLALLFFLPFQSFRKAALYSTAFYLVYFFYGAGHDWIKEAFHGSLVTTYRFILLLLLGLFLGLFLYLKKTSRRFHRLVLYLNALFLVLVVVDLVEFGFKKPPFSEIINSATLHNPTAAKLTPCDTCNQEDIHLIILDEYAGEAQLKEVFGFDNSAFVSTLKAKGFYVVDQSRGNYNYTELSTASLLSLDYLQNLNGKNDNELYHIASTIINNNIFTGYLERLGYGINNFSIFDVNGTPAMNTHFKPKVSLITDQTLWTRLEKDVGFHLLYTLKLDFVLKRLNENIKKESLYPVRIMDSVVRTLSNKKGGGPQFYYTHLMLPHVPYYYNKNGQFIGLQRYLHPGSLEEEQKAYLEYLQYCNQKVLQFVEAILKNASRPPIILLMGDHGYRHETVERKYQFLTLNAVYFPDRQYKDFYKGMSHVNHLRLLLNNRFRQTLPLLKDTSFYLGKGITYP
jgi:hypothetical protein